MTSSIHPIPKDLELQKLELEAAKKDFKRKEELLEQELDKFMSGMNLGGSYKTTDGWINV